MNQIYKKNIQALKKVNPDLADKVNKAKKEDWIEIKEDNFLIKKRAKIIEAYPKAFRKELNTLGKQKIYHKDTATIIIGVGLGHMVYPIVKKMEKEHRVIIIEPIMQLIQESFKIYDFSKWIESTDLVFATTKEEINLTIAMFDEILFVQDWVTIAESYVMNCEEYAELISYSIEIVDKHRCNIGTVAGAGSILAENDIKNIPYIVKHRGVKDLKGLFKNKPAVCIATGPAIQNNIHLLKEVQDKVIIISMAQGLRMLLAYGIVPDFITTVDYGVINYEHFKGLMDENIPLVALNRTYAPILKHWQGTKFIAGTAVPGYENTATKIIEDKGVLESGGSVSHFSFQLAKQMGCNPIIFLGHGFDFSRGVSHTSQVDAGGEIKVENDMVTWKVTDPRSSIKDKDQFQGQLIKLPGIYGNPATMNVGLASFVTTFEEMFKTSTEKIINASEEGVKMKGCINMTFQKVIDNYLLKTIDKTCFNDLLTPDPDYKQTINNLIPVLKSDIENLENLIEKCDKGLESGREMLEAEVKKDYDKAVKENEKYSKEAHGYARKNPLVGVSIYGASRRIKSRELNVKGTVKHMWKNKEDMETRVERNKLILTAAKESAEKLIPMYQEVLDLFKKYEKTGDELLLQYPIKEKINLRDVNKYFKVGNWSHPLVDARKKIMNNRKGIWDTIKFELRLREYNVLERACEMRQKAIDDAIDREFKERRQDKLDYYEYVEEAQKLGKDHRKFKESLRLLGKAIKLFPEKKLARWGRASTMLKLDDDRAVKEYEQLVVEFPDDIRLKFECGIALVYTDLLKSLEYLEDVISRTREYDYFLRNMGELYLMADDKKKAIEAYKKYLKVFPADEKTKLKLQEVKNDGKKS